MEEGEPAEEGSECFFDYLPLEILSHILSFLPTIEDRKAASLVCRNWHVACQSPSVLKKEVLVITSEETIRELNALTKCGRIFPNVCIRGVDFKRTERRFWRKFAPFIRNLSIGGCNIREKSFVKLLKKCEELESLSIQDCKELFKSGKLLARERDRVVLEAVLGGVKTLSLGYNRYLYDSLFSRLTSVCKNIQELLLPGCYIYSPSSPYYRYYHNRFNQNSKNILTFNVIHDYIKEHAPRLKALSFAETYIEDEAVTAIAKTPNLAIEKMYLQGCFQVTNESLMTLSQYQSYLTHLDIALCPRVTDIALITICTRLTGLKFLSIQGCRNITEVGVSDLWRLTEILRLNISECEGINDAGLLKGLGTRQNNTLQELHMSHLIHISDKSVSEIMAYLPNLTHLDLSYCYKAITDKAVQSIFLHAKRLKTLILTMCEGLTDRGVTGIALELPSNLNSKESRLRHFIRTRDDWPYRIINDPAAEGIEGLLPSISPESDLKGSSLRHLENMQNLTLSGCNNITDLSLKYGLKISHLKCLDLSSCALITSEGMSYISQYNKSLEILNLNSCKNIDDEGVGYILTNLKRLKLLSLANCNITNHILQLLEVSTSNLRYLDVRRCNQLSAATIDEIITMFPGLQIVHSTEARDS